jgi:hypothetical protein
VGRAGCRSSPRAESTASGTVGMSVKAASLDDPSWFTVQADIWTKAGHRKEARHLAHRDVTPQNAPPLSRSREAVGLSCCARSDQLRPSDDHSLVSDPRHDFELAAE